MADQFVHHGSSPEVIAGGVVVLVRQLVKAAPSEALHFWDGSRMRSPIFDIFDAVLRCHSALQGRGKAQPFLSLLQDFCSASRIFPQRIRTYHQNLQRDCVSPQIFQFTNWHRTRQPGVELSVENVERSLQCGS